MRCIQFTVDAALLSELGERLVGQPHIALAELIKNSYDADATAVGVVFDDDSIEVVDNGHGMDAESFESFWMRIGSPHKAGQHISPKFGRPLTGSKGVGRLAAQFLASRLELATRSDPSGNVLTAAVDWEDAVDAGELTEAEALVDDDAPKEAFAEGSLIGTRIKLTGLRQTWDAGSLKLLALVLWPLQPPFDRAPDADDEGGFRVKLETGDVDSQVEFDRQMRAVLSLWTARIIGTVASDDDRETSSTGRQLQVEVRFSDDDVETLALDVRVTSLDHVSFDIRIFDLHNRQRFGVAVDEARDYIRSYGGIHIYDAGFHLPYYGADTDWLGIEQAHAKRLTLSKLLPDELQVSGGLEYLPTNSRIYGIVEVNTGHEQDRASNLGRPVRDALSIQVSRDRLIDNAAFRELREIVRTSMDFYATRAALRASAAKHSVEPPGDLLTSKARSFEEAVESIRDELPEQSYRTLTVAAREVSSAAESEAENVARNAGLLGALATAGMAAVAYEHEATRQLNELDRLRRKLARNKEANAAKLADEIGVWIKQARATRSLFSPLLDEANRAERNRLHAKSVLEQVATQTRVLLRGVECDFTEVDDDFKLPLGTFSEWSALWQNVFVNASNAMIDMDVRRLKAISSSTSTEQSIILMDTGGGIDLNDSESYFEPFARSQTVSAERRGLGVGGTGLGLTIVRMIANNLRCATQFVESPDSQYATAFELNWKFK